MKNIQLSTSGVSVSSVVLGLMRINTLDDSGIKALYSAAREIGINIFDHADIYGGAPHR